MKKKEIKNQLLFNSLLEEVDKKRHAFKKEDVNLPHEEKNLLLEQQEKLKEKRKQLIKERYTTYCIEWILGLHLKTRLTSKFLPHIDKILPLHSTTVRGENHNFLSALVAFKDYQWAYLYLNHPTIQKMLFSEKAPALLNMKQMKKDLKEALMQPQPFQNKDLASLWGILKQIYGAPKLAQMVLFDADEKAPLDTKTKACFSKNGVRQTALSFLISKGALLESLDYMRSLPSETTLAEVSALVSDPVASQELKRIASKKHFKNKEEVFFLNTLEKSLPTDLFLNLMHKYQGPIGYKDTFFNQETEKQLVAYLQKNDKTLKR